MYSFFRTPIGGDPSSEMDAFTDTKAKQRALEADVAKAVDTAVDNFGLERFARAFSYAGEIEEAGYEVGRIVGKNGSNFIVQVGNERREVPPTDIKKVIG